MAFRTTVFKQFVYLRHEYLCKTLIFDYPFQTRHTVDHQNAAFFAFDEDTSADSDFDLDFTEAEANSDYSDYGEDFEDYDKLAEALSASHGNDYIGTELEK
uniref:Uncharacterized protein n=1 Tax=Globodera pallida TaxID=36090 RepID=A0A183BHJ6_GLOPA